MSRILQSDEIKDLVSSLAKAQEGVHHAFLDAENPFFTSTYATLESVIDAVKPAFLKEGLVIVQQPSLDESGRNILITTLAHVSGQWMRSFTEILNEKKTCQSMGSGITYARRYALAAMAGIGQTDDDGNAATGNQDIKPPQSPLGSAANSQQKDLVKLKPTGKPTQYRDPRLFKLGFGKYKGKTLGEVNFNDLVSYYTSLVNMAAEENKPLSEMAATFGRALNALKLEIEAGKS